MAVIGGRVHFKSMAANVVIPLTFKTAFFFLIRKSGEAEPVCKYLIEAPQSLKQELSNDKIG
jgi:hypothetical protein